MPTKSKKSPPPKAPVKRKYDATSRTQKSLVVQQTIIETFVQLLAERRGEEVNIDEIAERSGISERTIYRLFNDKASLSEATDGYMRSYLLSTGEQVANRSVPEFATYVFTQFGLNENLVLAYLHSRFGINARVSFRQKFNQILMAKILQEKNLTMTKELEMKLAVIVSLVNAKIWNDIRSDFGFKSEDIGRSVGEAISILIENL